MGVWSPSNGISANGVQTSQVNFDTGIPSLYQTAKMQNLPETCLKESLSCEITPF